MSIGSFYRRELTPTRFIIFGYLFFVIVGSLLLTLPFSSTQKRCSLIDSVFTATSAVCVTGLIVKDTEYDFSLFGKVIILLLIQAGGIGYMTLATTFSVILKRKISLRERLIIKESFNQLTFKDLAKFSIRVLQISLILEFIGAFILFFRFTNFFPYLKSAGVSIFHSISAFCNAGFSCFSTNLVNYQNDFFIAITVPVLFIIGGVGFICISDLYKTYLKRETKAVSVHTKFTILITLTLIVCGTILILFNEWGNAFNEMALKDKLMVSFFHATTPRTAGFSIFNIRNFTLPTIACIIFFMFVGASPGGTGGGVKTTTFGIVLHSIKNMSRSSPVNLFKRQIADDTIRRAFLITVIAGSIISLGTFILLFTEGEVCKNKGFLGVLFEQTSALGTVGLSLGSFSNPNLSLAHNFTPFGKLIIILTMLSGRIGPLTIGSAVLLPKEEKIKFPETRLVIG